MSRRSKSKRDAKKVARWVRLERQQAEMLRRVEEYVAREDPLCQSLWLQRELLVFRAILSPGPLRVER